jgi:hypothetical protein
MNFDQNITKPLRLTLLVCVGFLLAHFLFGFLNGIGLEQLFSSFQVKRLSILAMVIFLGGYFMERRKSKSTK